MASPMLLLLSLFIYQIQAQSPTFSAQGVAPSSITSCPNLPAVAAVNNMVKQFPTAYNVASVRPHFVK